MGMKLNVEKVISEKMVSKIVADLEKSKSGKMKELFMGGLEVDKIAELMGVRYNFVYNVVSNMVVCNKLDVIKEDKKNIKAEVIEKIKLGMKKMDISKELGVNYNYIFKIEKEYKASLESVAVAE